MSTGYSGTPLAKKLGLKPGMVIRLFDPPSDYWSLVGDDAEGLGLTVPDPGGDAVADVTHLFATDLGTLEAHFAAARRGMATDGMVWASWPKKSSGVESDVGRADVMRAGKAAGLVDIKVAAVDETWSGLKFVIPVADR